MSVVFKNNGIENNTVKYSISKKHNLFRKHNLFKKSNLFRKSNWSAILFVIPLALCSVSGFAAENNSASATAFKTSSIYSHIDTSPVTAQQIDQMTNLIIDLMPLHIMFSGEMFTDKFAELNLSKTELKCVTSHLSRDDYFQYRRNEVVLYALNNPRRFAYDLAFLNNGLSKEMGAVFSTLFKQASKEDAKTNSKGMIEKMSPNVLLDFMTLTGDKNFSELNDLTKFSSFNRGGSSFAKMLESLENQSSADNAALSLMGFIINAGDQCNLNMFEKMNKTGK